MEIEYGAHSIKGKDHFLNEDRYRLLGQHIPLVEQADQGQIFAVFDGMGSAPRGGEAAQLVCDSLISLYKGKRSEPLDHICEKLKEANMVIHGWGRTESGRAPMGAAAGTVNVHIDGLIRVVTVQIKKLRDDYIGNLVADGRT